MFRKILAGLLAAAVVLTLAEVLARVATTVRRDWLARGRTAWWLDDPGGWLIYSPRIGWLRRPGFKGEAGMRQREFDSGGYLSIDSPKVLNASQPRVMFVGDSNTFGYGVDSHEAFPQIADDLLPEAAAINLGVMGFSSYQGRLLVERYLPTLRPAVLVVSFNFNDRRYAAEADGAAWFDEIYRQARHSWALRLSSQLEVLHLYKGVRGTLRRVGIAPTAFADRVAVELARPRVSEEDYERHLSWIADQGKRNGVPVVFLMLRDNPIQTANIDRGVAYLASGDYEMAIAHLSEGADARNDFSLLAQVYLAKALRAKGDAGAASSLTTTQSPSFDGTVPVRLNHTYNEIVTRVARERGAVLVDAGRVVDEHPADYIDECHFNARAHRRVGELLAKQLREVLADAQR